MIFPEESGAHLPGRLNAQITFNPKSLAFSKSTPPGFDAKSITTQSEFIVFKELPQKTVF